MAQITIYLDQETAERMRAFVESRRISQSKWVAELIRERLQTEWPEHIVELAGAWKDFPTVEEIREDLGHDVPREKL
ncbi:MAG: hypothetical protein R3293_26770 [Candidatus Promineifilaceae bacterium]|nr:hypothetical protein [Candidatus Promineifilaceae bacterium]